MQADQGCDAHADLRCSVSLFADREQDEEKPRVPTRREAESFHEYISGSHPHPHSPQWMDESRLSESLRITLLKRPSRLTLTMTTTTMHSSLPSTFTSLPVCHHGSSRAGAGATPAEVPPGCTMATAEDWRTHRQTVTNLYEERTLSKVMNIMQQEHGFFAT
jgi:hypothetical protein